MLTAILVGILVALVSTLIIKLVKWTIGKIKAWKSKKQTEVIAGKLKDIAKDPRVKHVSMKDLEENPNSVMYAEYDPQADEVIKYEAVADCEQNILNVLNANDGVVVLED